MVSIRSNLRDRVICTPAGSYPRALASLITSGGRGPGASSRRLSCQTGFSSWVVARMCMRLVDDDPGRASLFACRPVCPFSTLFHGPSSISTPTTPATLRGCSWTASSPSSQGSGQDARCCLLVMSCPIAVCPLSFHRSSKKPRKDLEKERRSRHHPTPGSAPLPFLDRVSSSDTWPLFCFGCHVRSSRLEGITSDMDLRHGYILCLASAPGCHIVCSTKIGWDGEARSTCMWIDNVP